MHILGCPISTDFWHENEYTHKQATKTPRPRLMPLPKQTRLTKKTTKHTHTHTQTQTCPQIFCNYLPGTVWCQFLCSGYQMGVKVDLTQKMEKKLEKPVKVTQERKAHQEEHQSHESRKFSHYHCQQTHIQLYSWSVTGKRVRPQKTPNVQAPKMQNTKK